MTIHHETIATQRVHRTIRKFTGEPVPSDVLEALFEVARSTASSRGLQLASIIRVTDSELKSRMAKVCNQGYVADAPELLVFIVDTHRAQRIMEEKDQVGIGARSMYAFGEGWTDACLMAQNMVVAAESLGLGTNYYGSVLNDPAQVIDILGLPELTFPVVGLGIGYPDQDPQLKPRMEMSLRVMNNGYVEPDSWVSALANYDEAMQTYYDLRENGRRSDCYTQQIVDKFATDTLPHRQLLRYVQAQGWDLALED